VKQLTYGVLASGSLGAICLEKINDAGKINFVCCDKKSQSIIDYCQREGLPVYIGNPRTDRIKDFLTDLETDVIISVNYLFIVDQAILQHPKKYAINFHGSLLPKYRGRTPHVWAIINNESYTGITGHLMTGNCDDGDIVYQERIEIGEDATGAELLNLFATRYPLIINDVIRSIEAEEVKLISQDDTKATFFEKRSPSDGKINWNWQKERIRNWVRAQAKPYPGAFTFYGDYKVTVHKVAYDECGFHQSDLNGKIIGVNDSEVVVKTSNGALRLMDMEVNENIIFKIGEIFHD